MIVLFSFSYPRLLIAAMVLLSVGAFAQEYTYDVNGNLKTDGNKQIASIQYNYMNLADTILYSDGRKMIYTYTATGQKLSEKSMFANGTIKQKRDYAGSILYRNDSLREIKHEDGRAVPVTPGNNTTSWEYQYHLSDHLGNVRSTLTSKQETETNTSTFESTNATAEQNKYLRYNVTRKINAALFDHTHTGTTHYSERLNGSANERYGIARSLSVMPGDIIKLEAYAKYIDPNQNNLTQALTTLLTQVASGTAPAGTVVDGAGYATNGNTPFVFAGLNNTSGSSGSGPKAYLNWLVFDRNFIFKNGGYVRMTTAAKENGSNVPHEKLFKELVIKEPGYVYMYLSNEETTPLEVYFDDVSVTQVNSPVIQQNDYDPFGLTFHDYARENAVPNNFLYNGKELQNDFDLNWYDYGARMYDAALGRWHVIDPKAEKYPAWSPYNYVMNNPVKFVDPDGKEISLGKENIGIQQSEADQKALHEAYETLKQTEEGKDIASFVESDALSVHVAMINPIDVNGQHPLAMTHDPVREGSIKLDKASGKFTVQVDKESIISVFNGLDVTKAVMDRKEIRLVMLCAVKESKTKKYNLASALAHELTAHGKFSLWPWPIALSNIGKNTELIEHLYFGASDGPVEMLNIVPYKGGQALVVESSAYPDSPADKVNRQLGLNYAREMGIRYVITR